MKKTCHDTTSSTKSPIHIAVGLKSDLRGEQPARGKLQTSFVHFFTRSHIP